MDFIVPGFVPTARMYRATMLKSPNINSDITRVFEIEEWNCLGRITKIPTTDKNTMRIAPKITNTGPANHAILQKGKAKELDQIHV